MNDGDGGYYYVGEIIDPEQTPLTAAVYECRECGALATFSGMATHLAWHRKQEKS